MKFFITRNVFVLRKVQGEITFLSAGSRSPKLCRGTAFPPAEHAILAALIAGNFLRSAKIRSINRNVMTQGNDSQVEGSAACASITWFYRKCAAKLWSSNRPVRVFSFYTSSSIRLGSQKRARGCVVLSPLHQSSFVPLKCCRKKCLHLQPQRKTWDAKRLKICVSWLRNGALKSKFQSTELITNLSFYNRVNGLCHSSKNLKVFS